MKKRRYEKTQGGNPYQLTVKQHIIPNKSISRFVNQDGFVEVWMLGADSTIKLRPSNALFCAMRSWDHRTEHGLIKGHEDRFQKVADEIVIGGRNSLSGEECHAITGLFLLWRLKHRFWLEPLDDAKLNGVLGVNTTKDEQEILEKNGYAFAKPDGSFPGRIMAGPLIAINLDRDLVRYGALRWGVFRSRGREFIMPDIFGSQAVMPLSPRVCLVADSPDGLASDAVVAQINRMAISCAQTYYFAKNFRAT